MFLLRLVWAVVHALFAKKADLVAENLALRQQLIVFRRNVGRPRLRRRDRIFLLWLDRSWSGWRDTLIVAKPATVVRGLIRRMSRANPLWGAPRIHGELLKLGRGGDDSILDKHSAIRQPKWSVS